MLLFALVLGAAFAVALSMASLDRLPAVSVDSGHTPEPTEEVHVSNRHRKGPRYEINRMRFVGACLVMIAAGLIALVAWFLLQAYQ